MPEKAKLTAENCSRLLPRTGRERDWISDTSRGHVRGLRLMVTGAGSRSWYYVYKPAGSRLPVQVYLGDANAPEMGLAQARVAAREQRLLRDQGKDPRDERRLAEAERRREAAQVAKLEKETLAAAVDAYIEANRDEWSPVTVHERERMARVYLPKMPSCNHPVTEVRPFEVRTS